MIKMEIEIELVGKGKAIAELDQRNPITANKIIFFFIFV